MVDYMYLIFNKFILPADRRKGDGLVDMLQKSKSTVQTSFMLLFLSYVDIFI